MAFEFRDHLGALSVGHHLQVVLGEEGIEVIHHIPPLLEEVDLDGPVRRVHQPEFRHPCGLVAVLFIPLIPPCRTWRKNLDHQVRCAIDAVCPDFIGITDHHKIRDIAFGIGQEYSCPVCERDAGLPLQKCFKEGRDSSRDADMVDRGGSHHHNLPSNQFPSCVVFLICRLDAHRCTCLSSVDRTIIPCPLRPVKAKGAPGPGAPFSYLNAM